MITILELWSKPMDTHQRDQYEKRLKGQVEIFQKRYEEEHNAMVQLNPDLHPQPTYDVENVEKGLKQAESKEIPIPEVEKHRDMLKPKQKPKRTRLLEEGIAATLEDREKTHGDWKENHDLIAKYWNIYIAQKVHVFDAPTITGADVCAMMALLKLARHQSGEKNEDDYIDGAVYFAGISEW